jgi:hypothetical protein
MMRAMGAIIWRHVVVSTKGRWLHGDPRGFRSREHRIHASGDHKNPPPREEHEKLHAYQKARSAPEVVIAPDLRMRILIAFTNQLLGEGWRVLVSSMSDTHLHALAHLPADRRKTKLIVGEAKKVASRAVRAELPGSIWSANGSYKPIADNHHQIEAFHYILERQEEGAVVWDYRKALPPGP